MFLRIMGLLVAWAGMAVCGFAASRLADEELDEVNRLLPPERRFARHGWNPGKWMDLSKESRRLGISPRYRRRQTSVTIAGIFCTLAAFWLLSGLHR